MTSNLAPIVLFCYNRPWHVEQTLIALSKNELADKSVLYIYCDGPKENATEEQINNIKLTREAVKKEKWCKEVYIIESGKNKGLANSIIGGVTEIVNKYGKIIVLEDDMVTSPYFLQYMNDSLEMYKDDNQVMHVTGFMFPINKKMPDTFFYQVPHCWSWGTWSRSWKYFSNDINELYSYWSKDWKKFNKWGWTDLQEQLESNYKGTLYTWFIKWHAVVLRMNGLTLYPHKSLIFNIGNDGSGENCCSTNKYNVDILNRRLIINKIPIRENRKVASYIKIWNSGHWYSRRYRVRLINKLKSFFKHICL